MKQSLTSDHGARRKSLFKALRITLLASRAGKSRAQEHAGLRSTAVLPGGWSAEICAGAFSLATLLASFCYMISLRTYRDKRRQCRSMPRG